MRKLHFNVEGRPIILGSHDAVYLSVESDITDLPELLTEAVIQNISTDLEITISGVTMFLAAWQDPAHWTEEWSEKLECDRDEVVNEVGDLLMSAIEEDKPTAQPQRDRSRDPLGGGVMRPERTFSIDDKSTPPQPRMVEQRAPGCICGTGGYPSPCPVHDNRIGD